MSLQRLAAGCVLAGFDGHEPPDWLRRALADGLGGVCLFAGNVRDEAQVAALTAALRAERPEVLVAVDEEGGDVTRLEWKRGSSYPGNLALGAVDDVGLTERVAAAIGSDLARAGIWVNLAPVADVNSNPRNPVIGVRSFGSDPELVARHVAAFVGGTQSAGVAACAKHFPGHGDTAQDSHLELPVARPCLEPFRAAIAAGVRCVMTGHLLVPELDDRPATLSRRIVGDLLRGELGFDGLVVSDALDMRALAAPVGELAADALAAGVDALILGNYSGERAVGEVVDAVVAAVREGRLAEERVAESAARVAGLSRPPAPISADRSVGVEAARRAVQGSARLGSDPLVVELVTPANIAAGEREHGLLPGARRIRLR
ncbi:MAG TPA: glycoside hydrolase family 3 protein, partial [Gaiellaceae bacterium]